MVDEVILKKQVTSYLLEKNITAITKVITDVWRKGWARRTTATLLFWSQEKHLATAQAKQMDALQWLAVVSCGSHLSADKLNMYTHETYDWLSACEGIHLRPKRDGRPVVLVRALVQLLQAVIASRLLQDNLGTDKSFSLGSPWHYTLAHVLWCGAYRRIIVSQLWNISIWQP